MYCTSIIHLVAVCRCKFYIGDSNLVSRSRTCCLRLGIVVRASTIVQAACLAAWVAGVNRTWDKERFQFVNVHICRRRSSTVINKCFITCRSQLLWLSLSRRGKRPSPFLDLMNCFHFQTYFSSRYCFRSSALPWGFDTASWPVVMKIFQTETEYHKE